MAKKKDAPPPMFTLRHEFVASLENLCQQALMMVQALDTVLQHDTGLKPGVRDLLAERNKALRAALLSED